MAWSPTLALRSWMKPSRWSGSHAWSPPCMAGMASSRHSASRAEDTPSSRLRASRISPRRRRSTTSVLRRLDQRALSWRLADSAVGLRPPCGSTSRTRYLFVMGGIVFRTPKQVSQEIEHRSNLHLVGGDVKPHVGDVPLGGDSKDLGVKVAVAHPRTVRGPGPAGIQAAGVCLPTRFPEAPIFNLETSMPREGRGEPD